MILIGQLDGLWGDPRLVYAVAIAGIVFLAITIWLFRRTKRDGRAAGAICLILAVGLHAALIWLVPYQQAKQGGSTSTDENPDSDGVEALTFSTFDPDMQIDEQSAQDEAPAIEPLPVAELDDLLADTSAIIDPAAEPTDEIIKDVEPDLLTDQPDPLGQAPETLNAESVEAPDLAMDSMAENLGESLDELMQSYLDDAVNADAPQVASAEPSPTPAPDESAAEQKVAAQTITTTTDSSMVPGSERADFANRIGAAKEKALLETGGDAQTEAAVQAALRF